MHKLVADLERSAAADYEMTRVAGKLGSAYLLRLVLSRHGIDAPDMPADVASALQGK